MHLISRSGTPAVLKNEHGSIALVVAAALPVLFLFALFALDSGGWFEHKHKLQNEVDAAALAAAQNMVCGPAGTTQPAAVTQQVASYMAKNAPSPATQAGVQQANVSHLVNSPTYPSGKTDSDPVDPS